MKEVRVRLLFHPSLGTPERLAALNGVKAFKKFGITYDCVDVMQRSRALLDDVKAGSRLREIVLAENPIAGIEDFRQPILDFIFDKTIFGLGITPNPLKEHNGTGAPENRIGLSLPGCGGIVSTSSMLELVKYLHLEIITASVEHELGHILGIKGHCNDEKCIMQANTSYGDFIRRFVVPALDFCRDCQARINAAVNRIVWP